MDAPESAAALQQLKRLFSPRHIAVFGGQAATEAIRQSRKLGFAGDLWPVHPHKKEIEGLRCYASVADLPLAPDASFIATPRQATIDIVAALAQRGAGGAVCYASGFAEVGGEGIALQAQLVRSAGNMALAGPNCYGMLNYLDGVALWPDQHGGYRLPAGARGVAIVTQSGNIGLNLTMQQRGLPLAYLITVGNKAGDSIERIVAALLQDPRVSAIGLHIEGLDDVAAFSAVALQALRQNVPVVALKAGSSELGAQTAMSHTSSLAGADALYDALFKRFGVARVHEPVALIETLKFLHVHGPLKGRSIISASCSGGEASLVADLAHPRGLLMPPIPAPAYQRLHAVLGDKVSIANPLDYHTYIWGNAPALTQAFQGLMDCGCDVPMLVLDYPRQDRCSADSWAAAVDGFAASAQGRNTAATVVASFPENLPETIAQGLIAQGIAPMQGLVDCMNALVHAADIGQAQTRMDVLEPLERLMPQAAASTDDRLWDEVAGKAALAAYGVPVPPGRMVDAGQAAACADALGYPVVIKAVSDQLAHKTEAGGVHLNIQNPQQVRAAVSQMAHLSDRFLVEQMAQNVVAEMIVGVQRDPQFGLTLTLGAGGVWVELLHDAVTLLSPVKPGDVVAALHSLKIAPLLQGFRGKQGGDVNALVQVVMAIWAYAQDHATTLVELDVNPVLVLPQGLGVVAVDVLIRTRGENLTTAFMDVLQ